MKLAKAITLSLIILGASAASIANAGNFSCPQPNEIQSTDFSVPSIWVAPAMPRSARDVLGLGLGGKEAKKLLGIEPYDINGKPGWVCIYESKGGTSFNEYRRKLTQAANSSHYLKRYVSKVTATFDGAEPFLKNYLTDKPLGFIGYQQR